MLIRARRRKGRLCHHNGQIQILDKGDYALIHAAIDSGIGEGGVEEGETRRNGVRASGILYTA